MTKLVSGLLAIVLASNVAAARDFAKAPTQVTPTAESKAPMQAPIDRAAVMTALAARRTHNLASFRAYVTAGVYPRNHVRPGPLNVWRDRDGRLCAAATMIDRDGNHDLVMKTAQDSNNLRLLDVTSGALMDWMLTSGLTIEEIDRIQKPAPRPNPSQLEPSWETKADAQLRADYDRTLKFLDANRVEGLASATDRLMANPVLARQLLDSTVVARRS